MCRMPSIRFDPAVLQYDSTHYRGIAMNKQQTKGSGNGTQQVKGAARELAVR
jgi:hypothetical protein